jgi:multicomponent Na+:H+ antiporter subunit C
VTLALAVAVGILMATGVYLILQRHLTRIVVGFGLLGHGANLLIIASGGRAGTPAFIGNGDASDMADPLPQALVLTAIVIGFGMTGFLLTLAYRSWQVTHHDEVEDDLEDRRIARTAVPQEDTNGDEDGEAPRAADVGVPSP